MTKPDQVRALLREIADGGPSALEMLRTLATPCVHDERLSTPFSVAIRHRNHNVMELLLEDEAALEYCPSLEKEDVARLRTMVAHGVGRTVEAIENFLVEHQRVPFPYWQRTPLLEACRYENTDAVKALVSAGASLSVKDALGLDALDLCLESTDDALVHCLVGSCVDCGRPLTVAAGQLEAAARRPAVWDLLLQHGKLAAPAKRLAFNVACARLDEPAVRRMIADGYKPASAVSVRHHPVLEAATSYLAWSLGLPDFADLAAGLAHAYGHPDSTTLTDADLFDEEGNAISFQEADARRLERSAAFKRNEPDPSFVSDDQLGRRVALLELLAEHGLSPGKYRGEFLANVIATNRPELLAHLKDLGFKTGPSEGGADLEWALLCGCYSMVNALQSHGHSIGRDVKSHRPEFAAYQTWLGTVGGPDNDPAHSQGGQSAPDAPAPEATWELGGESVLTARLLASPRPGVTSTVHLAHENVYGPVDGVDLFVRIGDPDTGPPLGATSSVDDWIAARLVEEALLIEDDEVPRDAVREVPPAGAPWRATYQAPLVFPSGRVRLEVRVSSQAFPDLNGVLADWVFRVSSR